MCSLTGKRLNSKKDTPNFVSLFSIQQIMFKEVRGRD